MQTNESQQSHCALMHLFFWTMLFYDAVETGHQMDSMSFLCYFWSKSNLKFSLPTDKGKRIINCPAKKEIATVHISCKQISHGNPEVPEKDSTAGLHFALTVSSHFTLRFNTFVHFWNYSSLRFEIEELKINLKFITKHHLKEQVKCSLLLV